MAQVYARVFPQFWTGQTGCALRNDRAAQLLALYLISSPHANLIGLYYLPLPFASHELGIDHQEIIRAMTALESLKFCAYEVCSEHVFVIEMMRFQLGEKMHPDDKRGPAIIRELEGKPQELLRLFFERYGEAYGLDRWVGMERRRHRKAKIPPALRIRVLERHGRRCVYCGAKADDRRLNIIHIKPESEGGETTFKNLESVCEDCHSGVLSKWAEGASAPIESNADEGASAPIGNQVIIDGAEGASALPKDKGAEGPSPWGLKPLGRKVLSGAGSGAPAPILPASPPAPFGGALAGALSAQEADHSPLGPTGPGSLEPEPVQNQDRTHGEVATQGGASVFRLPEPGIVAAMAPISPHDAGQALREGGGGAATLVLTPDEPQGAKEGARQAVHGELGSSNWKAGKTRVSRVAWMADFERFWVAWKSAGGERAGRGKAEEAFEKHVARPGVPLGTVLVGLSRWPGSRKWVEGYVPNPATWLNQHRWQDDPAQDDGKTIAQRARDTRLETASDRLLQRAQAMYPNANIVGREEDIDGTGGHAALPADHEGPATVL